MFYKAYAIGKKPENTDKLADFMTDISIKKGQQLNYCPLCILTFVVN